MVWCIWFDESIFGVCLFCFVFGGLSYYHDFFRILSRSSWEAKCLFLSLRISTIYRTGFSVSVLHGHTSSLCPEVEEKLK